MILPPNFKTLFYWWIEEEDVPTPAKGGYEYKFSEKTFIKYSIYKEREMEGLRIEAEKEINNKTLYKVVEVKKISANPKKKEVKKDTTKDGHFKKLSKISDLVEQELRRGGNSTKEDITKIFKKAIGKYSKDNNIDRSQLKREIDSAGGLNYVLQKMESIDKLSRPFHT